MSIKRQIWILTLVPTLAGLCLLSLWFSTTFAESQIVIDPVTKTITIVTSWTGTINTGTVSTGGTSTWTITIQAVSTGWVLTGTEFQQALSRMFTNGLTKYNIESDYRPNDFLTRQEAAKIIGQAYIVLGYEQTSKNSECGFSDTTIMDSTLISHVDNACKRWLFKWSQGKFMPMKALTRPETMAVLIRMFEGKTSVENWPLWWSDYYFKGQAIGLTTVNNQTAFDSSITRQEIAIYIYRLKNIVTNQTNKANAINKINQMATGAINQATGSESSQLTTDFSALAGSISVDKDPELQEAIRWMNDNSLTSYKTIQEYLPFEILTREQSAKILYTFAQVFNFTTNPNIALPAECIFTDISTADASLLTYIENACKSNIMKGKNNKFLPRNTINKAEFITAMIRMFEGKKLDETNTPRWKNYFEKANEMGIVSPADAITFEQPITRYEVALFLYRFKVKYQMLNALNTNKLSNEIINTVPGSITTGTNNMKESNVYIDMNSIENGNFEVGYIEIFGTRYKVVKSSTEKYFSNNYVRYGDVFDLEKNEKIGTISLIVSNGYTIEWTIRLPDHDYLLSQLSDTNSYYKIKQIR